MNLENQKITGTNMLYVQDALSAPLTSFKLKRNQNTSGGVGNHIMITIDRSSNAITSEVLHYSFEIDEPLRYYNGVSDEFVLETIVNNGNVKMEAKVIRRIEETGYLDYAILTNEVIEIVENYPMPIMLLEGVNYIFTNYTNADLEMIYSKDDIANRQFLSNASFYAHKLSNGGDFSLDDIYFKDAFTKIEDNLSLDIDSINVGSLTSKNNTFSLDTNGNLVVNSITTNSGGNTLDTEEIIDLIYPVGSIYLSVNNTNPTTLFGGTWEQIKDRFLLAAGDSYLNGSTGGEASHVLTINEMPSHSHSWSQSSCSNPGDHTHIVGADKDGGPGSNRYTVHITSNNTAYGQQYSPASGAAGSHTHTIGGNNTNTGGGQAHNNMPPYLAVKIWKRTA